ncbi:DUF2577 domain-containing protein [Brevibacillus composti]|uniref:DUF2577 domain-containing protein n=1 Tax=Brevibacillus composti TaxID=2796470 RepID=A0A7T5EID1_9BACL|nr:DUF2577 domain-containing protein [Brevibacillus composti]QQE73150.1 DUF2577 domain-containing protein [Brevibacillus composti]QUO40228.1 DUF2577 domain-containing protein [Brevibacillus composti]
MTRLEGSGVSQLKQMIARIGYNRFDRLELATVVSPPPDLRIRIDNMALDLEADDLVVAEHLTRHKRIVTITHEELAERDLGDKIERDGLDTDDMVEGNPITEYRHAYVELTFEDVLKPGDRVIVASMNDGQAYLILDRVVMYRQ